MMQILSPVILSSDVFNHNIHIISLPGALLSHFIAPVYLTSVTFGSLFSREHATRAIYGRIAEVQNLPEGFQVNRPTIGTVTVPQTRRAAKALNYAVLWYEGLEEEFEVINTQVMRCCFAFNRYFLRLSVRIGRWSITSVSI